MNENLLNIDPADFASLSDRELVSTCIQPTIEKIMGKNLLVKSSVFSSLSAGQKSVLSFWILTGHFKYGVVQFLQEINYLMHEIDIWKELKNGIKIFGNGSLTSLVEDMEKFHKSLKDGALTQNEMESGARQIDGRFEKIIADSYQSVADYIRGNRSEFVRLE